MEENNSRENTDKGSPELTAEVSSTEKQQSCPQLTITVDDFEKHIENTDGAVTLLNNIESQEKLMESQDKLVESQDNIVESQDKLMESQDKLVESHNKILDNEATTETPIEGETKLDNGGVVSYMKDGWPNKIMLPIILAIFGIVMSTYDIWTDGNLFEILYSNGQTNWGILVLVPIFANTIFNLCSMLYSLVYSRGSNNCKKTILATIFSIFVLFQLYPQLCTSKDLVKLVISRDMPQFTRKQTHASGIQGTLESFIEATPNLYIQTAFLAHTGLSLSTLKQKTCFKLNCFNLDAQQEECKNVLNQTEEVANSTNCFSVANSTEKHETCKETQLKICKNEVKTCILKLEVQMSNLTLSDLHLDQTEKWKNTTLHKNYDMSKRDLDTVALYLILFGDGSFTFWSSYILSYLSAAYGITSYLKNGSGRFISNLGGTFAKVFVAVLLSLLWKVIYLYSLVRLSGLSEFLNIFFWILTCFLPQFVYITTRVYLKCPQAFTSFKNFLIFKQPQVFLLTVISPVAFDVEIKDSSTELESFAVFKVSKTSTQNANTVQAIISLPFILKLMLVHFFSPFYSAWMGWMNSVMCARPGDSVLIFLLILLVVVSGLAVVLTLLVYFVVFACANMLLLTTDIFDNNDGKLRECALHDEILCKKCHAKFGVVFATLSDQELEAQRQKEEEVLNLYERIKNRLTVGISSAVIFCLVLYVLAGIVFVVYYWFDSKFGG